MANENKDVLVTCPVCQIERQLSVPGAIFSQKKFGTIKIQVPTGAVCDEHQFIVFVDSKGVVRGYEKIDIQMAIPAGGAEEVEVDIEGALNLKKLIQIFGTYGIFCLLRAQVFDYKVYIKTDNHFKQSEDELNAIGDRLLPEKYRGGKTYNLLTEEEYNKMKLKNKNVFVMDTNQHIFQTPWEEKLKFEESTIKKALDIIDEEEQLILIQQSVAKLIKEAEHTKNILENVREIYEDDLMESLSRGLLSPKMSHSRLMLIKSFIKQRFSPKLAAKIKNKVEEFLDLL